MQVKAIFIGGPLHGKVRQVEPSHRHVAWVPPRVVDDCSEVVEYYTRFNFGEVTIFTMCGTANDADKQLVEAIERGLQLQPEPPMRWIIERLQRCGEIMRRNDELEFLCKYLCDGWEWEQKKQQHRR